MGTYCGSSSTEDEVENTEKCRVRCRRRQRVTTLMEARLADDGPRENVSIIITFILLTLLLLWCTELRRSDRGLYRHPSQRIQCGLFQIKCLIIQWRWCNVVLYHPKEYHLWIIDSHTKLILYTQHSICLLTTPFKVVFTPFVASRFLNIRC